MSLCRSCGAQIPADSKFCGFCGFAVEPLWQPTQASPQNFANSQIGYPGGQQSEPSFYYPPDLDSFNSNCYITDGHVQYAMLLLDILRTDQRYANCIESVQIPGLEDYKKAAGTPLASDLAGYFLGIKWNYVTNATIKLQHNLITKIEIAESDFEAQVDCYFPLPRASKPKEYFCGEGRIVAVFSGMVQKKLVGVIAEKQGRSIPGFEEIANDRYLLGDLFFAKSSCQLLHLAKEENAIVKFSVSIERDKTNLGKLTVFPSRNVSDEFLSKFGRGGLVPCTRRLFDTLFGIAQHINSACWLRSSPPPPPPPQA
jgi:hypothetical protein